MEKSITILVQDMQTIITSYDKTIKYSYRGAHITPYPFNNDGYILSNKNFSTGWVTWMVHLPIAGEYDVYVDLREGNSVYVDYAINGYRIALNQSRYLNTWASLGTHKLDSGLLVISSDNLSKRTGQRIYYGDMRLVLRPKEKLWGLPVAGEGLAWPYPWVDVNPYGSLYTLGNGTSAYHTGSDLNANYSPDGKPHWDYDRGQPLFAIGKGIVTFAGRLATWGYVIVTEHESPFGRFYVRYGHVHNLEVRAGESVSLGQKLAVVGNATPEPAQPYHLHLDISLTDKLKLAPYDWPARDKSRVLKDYTPVREFINQLLSLNK